LQFPSKLIEHAVSEISRLPGIGKKTALRLALHLLKQEEKTTVSLADALIELRTKTVFCKQCNNISDTEICQICTSFNRDQSLICVVEDTRDVLALENTGQYNGKYFVLGGIISPINGIGPNEIKVEAFIRKFPNHEIKEVILALSPTMDGDTTAFYLSKKLKQFNLKITTIARGIPIGGELEYADEITLGRSIQQRIKYGED
jgi:recombination protein RecR